MSPSRSIGLSDGCSILFPRFEPVLCTGASVIPLSTAKPGEQCISMESHGNYVHWWNDVKNHYAWTVDFVPDEDGLPVTGDDVWPCDGPDDDGGWDA